MLNRLQDKFIHYISLHLIKSSIYVNSESKRRRIVIDINDNTFSLPFGATECYKRGNRFRRGQQLLSLLERDRHHHLPAWL